MAINGPEMSIFEKSNSFSLGPGPDHHQRELENERFELLKREYGQSVQQMKIVIDKLRRWVSAVDDQDKRLKNEIRIRATMGEILKDYNETLMDSITELKGKFSRLQNENEVLTRGINQYRSTTGKAELELESLISWSEVPRAQMSSQLNAAKKLQKELTGIKFELQCRYEGLESYYQGLRRSITQKKEAIFSRGVNAVQLDALHAAELIVVKHSHEFLIFEMNELKYRLWSEKFALKEQIERETKMQRRYRLWLAAALKRNTKLRSDQHQEKKQIAKLQERLRGVVEEEEEF